jgi:hypothetical protein
MTKRSSLLLMSVAAAVFLLSAVASVSAAQRGVSNRGGGEVEPQSPVGTRLGSALLWAVVNADGSTLRSDGANPVLTRKLPGFNGSYEVIFRRNVTECAYIATIGYGTLGNPLHGSIVAALRGGNNHGVFVETRDSPAGALSDRPFHVFVNC